MRNFGVALIAVVLMIASAETAGAQMEKYRRDFNYSSTIDYDRYINVEVWTDTDEYYEGDNITLYFRADKDCYVVLYNVDTKGNVNIIYPGDQWDDQRIERDRVYRIPDSYDDYDLTVRGPAGVEYVQVVASMMPLPIPEWGGDYGPVAEGDPIDYMDYINAEYFGKDNRIALDMTLFRVKEWQQAYYRPVYNYHQYDWHLSGMVYIDYPWGATVYVDGVYWGIAPLYIPRIYYGWHWVTVYDPWGYCWEDRVHIVRHQTVILDQTKVKTSAGVKSRYREIRSKGYLKPAKNGYPEYQKTLRTKQDAMESFKSRRVGADGIDSRLKSTSGRGDNSRSKTSTTYNTESSRGKTRSGDDSFNRSTAKSRSSNRSSSSDSDSYRSRGNSSRSGGSDNDDYNRSSTKSRSSSRSSGRSNDSYRSRGSGSSDSDNSSSKSRSSSSSSSSGSYKRSSGSSSSGSGSSRSGSGSSSSGSSSRSKGSGSEGSSKRGR